MSDEYVEEACFYLKDLGSSSDEIGSQLNLTPSQVDEAVSRFKKRLNENTAKYDEEAKKFWAQSLRESSGDEKITLVDEKGRYYHGWKSELKKMTTEELAELYFVNKEYSDKHPLSEFSKSQPVVGYDPLIPLRNIRRSMSLIDEVLQKRGYEERT
jgi:hypothetical protein